MKPILHVAFILATFLLIAAPAPAQDARTEHMARWVDESVFLVIRIDLTAISPELGINTVRSVLANEASKAGEEAGDVLDGLNSAGIAASHWRQRFLAAGGSEIWAFGLFTDFTNAPFILVVPTTESSDTNALETIMKQLGGDVIQNMKRLPGAIVSGRTEFVIDAGTPSPIARFPLAEPSRAADLAAALEPVKDLPIQVASIPAAFVRRAFEEMAPTLPAEIGGAPMTTLTNGIVSASLGAAARPKTSNGAAADLSLSLKIRSKDEAAATALMDVLAKGQALAVQGATDSGLLDALNALMPKQDGAGLSLELTPGQVEKMIADLWDPLREARTAAQRVVAASSIRMIVQACILYSSQNKDQWPINLDVVIAAGMLTQDALASPIPGHAPFQYRQPSASKLQADISKCPVVFEGVHAWPKGGIWVGFADGHVERVEEQSEFDTLMALP